MSLPEPPAAGGAPKPSGFLDVFPKVALPMFLAISDQSIVATALPEMAGSFAAVQQISLVVICYLIAATIAAPVYGRLSDTFGRRKLMLCALGIFMVASIVCTFAANLPMLVAGRVLQGLGGGGLMALSQALIGETVAPRDRARYQGYLAAVGVTSNGIGPVVGGLLTAHLGWRAIFVFSLPIALLAFFLIWRMPRRPPHADAVRFDYAGLVLFASFVVSMLFLLQYVQHFRASDLPIMGVLLVTVVVSLALLVSIEHRVRTPLLPVDLFRDPTIWRANAIAACHGGILASLLTFMPIYLRVVHGAGPDETGLLLVPMTVSIGIGSLITGRIISRTGRTAILPSWGLAFTTIGLTIIAFYASEFRPIELSASLGLMALFLGTVMAVVQVTVLMAAGQRMLGASAAAVQYSRSLGAALGTALVATVLFATLSGFDPEAGRLFGEVLQNGTAVLDSLPVERSQIVKAEIAQSFRAAFLAIAGIGALSSVLVWTLPMRRL